MQVSQKIKLGVSASDAATLEFMQGKCRGLYNWWVMRLRNGELWPGTLAAKKTLKESRKHDPELNAVYNKLLQKVYFRLGAAMDGFFKRCQAGEKPGFPRVRPRHSFFTLCYPGSYLSVENNVLILPTGGRGKHKLYPDVRARLTEEAPAAFGEVAISRDGRGNYYASFSTQCQEQAVAQGEVVAFDLGVKTLAVGTNEQGRVYHIGGFKGSHWYNKQLDKIRSKRDKCKKRSRRYKYLSTVYQRVSEKKRNKQRDSLHKASHLIGHKLVERTVVVGDLSQRQMVTKKHHEKNKYCNRAIYNDWGLYTFIQMLTYKCLLYGKELVILDECNTSKMCSGCEHLQDMPLWKRTYRCPKCALVMDRDENSAVNILTRFLARRGPHAPDVECGVLHVAKTEVGKMDLPQSGDVQQLRLW
jgi:putative transposase